MPLPNARFNYADCDVLVTGGTSGIGHAIATAYADSGATVHVTGRKESAAHYQTELSRFHYHQLDVFSGEDIARIAAGIGRLDILINNAGGVFPRGVDEWSEQGFRDALEVNLLSHFRLSTAMKPKLSNSRLEGGASVIGIASLTSFFGFEMVPGYGAAKGALVQLTKTLAVAWAKDNIRCNAVAAGNIKTPLGGGMSEQQLENLYARLPIKRQGTPEDVAGAVLFLTSPIAAYITGQALPVDGGYTIALYL
jgi:NAD(P)-dependent dehydrogenase (short-subunit alcohol dehydrogenase family)